MPAAVLEVFENLKLVHVKDDGTAEIVPFTMNGNKATFEATGFSYYTFVGTEKAAVTPPADDDDKKDDGEIDSDDKKDSEDDKKEPGKSPNMGDSSAVLWILLAVLSVLSLAAAFALKMKRARG